MLIGGSSKVIRRTWSMPCARSSASLACDLGDRAVVAGLDHHQDLHQLARVVQVDHALDGVLDHRLLVARRQQHGEALARAGRKRSGTRPRTASRRPPRRRASARRRRRTAPRGRSSPRPAGRRPDSPRPPCCPRRAGGAPAPGRRALPGRGAAPGPAPGAGAAPSRPPRGRSARTSWSAPRGAVGEDDRHLGQAQPRPGAGVVDLYLEGVAVGPRASRSSASSASRRKHLKPLVQSRSRQTEQQPGVQAAPLADQAWRRSDQPTIRPPGTLRDPTTTSAASAAREQPGEVVRPVGEVGVHLHHPVVALAPGRSGSRRRRPCPAPASRAGGGRAPAPSPGPGRRPGPPSRPASASSTTRTSARGRRRARRAAAAPCSRPRCRSG